MTFWLTMNSRQIHDQCSPSWITHFAVFRSMIQQRLDGGRTCYLDDYIYRLGCRYFGCHLVMAKTTFLVEEVVPPRVSTIASIATHAKSQEAFCTDKSASLESSHCSWTSTENLALTMCPETLDNIDTYSGLSNRLLLLINEITDIKKGMLFSSRKPTSLSKVKEAALLTKAHQIRDNILNIQQFVPNFVTAADHPFGMRLEQTAEAYRLAALILLHESLSIVPSVSPVVLPRRNNQRVHIPLDSVVLDVDDKMAYIQSILTLVGEVLTQDAPNCSWPL